MTNVAHDVAYTQILQQLRALTAQMQDEVGDAPYAGPDTPRLEWPTARGLPGGPATPVGRPTPSRGRARRPPAPIARGCRQGIRPFIPTAIAAKNSRNTRAATQIAILISGFAGERRRPFFGAMKRSGRSRS